MEEGSSGVLLLKVARGVDSLYLENVASHLHCHWRRHLCKLHENTPGGTTV